jgi:hypothetical protein
MYTLLTFEGIVSWYFFGRLLVASRLSLWAGYGLASASILYTHYYRILLLIAQSCIMASLFRQGRVYRLIQLPMTPGAGWPRPLKSSVADVCRCLHRTLEVPLDSDGSRTPADSIGYRWLHPRLPGALLRNNRPSRARQASRVALGGPDTWSGDVGLMRDDSGGWRTPSAAIRERVILYQRR